MFKYFRLVLYNKIQIEKNLLQTRTFDTKQYSQYMDKGMFIATGAVIISIEYIFMSNILYYIIIIYFLIIWMYCILFIIFYWLPKDF